MSQAVDPGRRQKSPVLQWIGVLVLIYLLVVAVGMIGAGFKSATGERAEELFAFATNPFMGLIVGTVATALIQSSSTVTSIIVGLVAGGLPVATAVPMVMGANIGTTITNTLVSLGHVRDNDEFKKAFAAATVHDFFNLLSVIIFLPVEILFHPLERMGLALANALVGGGSMSVKDFNVVKMVTSPLVNVFKAGTHVLPAPFDGILLILLGIALIFLTIAFIGRLLKQLMVGRAKDILHMAIGRGPIAGILAGMLITILVQSSSTTTSLMVPLAGAGVFGLAQVYPFTLGANIGTCITALLAATAVSGADAVPALEIAMVHLLYNTLGVVIIYGIPFLCRLPIIGAENLAVVAAERKYLAFAYIIAVFFLIPGILLGITALA
ncbi:Na/Pi symporter [Oscillatoria sp. CS-180]|uniref:Na/Pi symporter n=1 Tax=Oscillatoria sp. CS-180 TaxID=3021720 RepID=UPI00232C7DAB|nr:Na/Pi symporter [Oscillatoria sp. CS-180]MDB9525043.1 Na/Pi symporter [Oscillatoria sp. CS-180]